MPFMRVLIKAPSGLMYIINNEISFNEEDGHLENSAAEVSVLMAMSTCRLLDVLISNQGNPVERDCLLKTVWDDNGLRSSNSNLNQYISILRKQLAQVGLPDNTVITLPRVGFMFSPEINVRRYIPDSMVQSPRAGRNLRYFISGRFYYPVFTLCVFLLCAGVFFLFILDRGPGMATLKKVDGYPPQCDVYALPGGAAVNKMGTMPFVTENCDKGSVYYIFKHIPPPDDSLIVSCEKSTQGYFSFCHNRREAKE